METLAIKVIAFGQTQTVTASSRIFMVTHQETTVAEKASMSSLEALENMKESPGAGHGSVHGLALMENCTATKALITSCRKLKC